MTVVVTPRACSYCAHTYANPCDGKDSKCQNKLFIDGKLPGISPPAKGNQHPVVQPKARERVPLVKKRERVPLVKKSKARVPLKR